MVASLNGERYREMISNLFFPKMQKLDLYDMWFQQDGATCHTVYVTTNLLSGELGEHFVSRAMLKLMSIQISALQPTHLFVRYRPKCWKEYAKIRLSRIRDAVAAHICMIQSSNIKL